MCRTASEAVVLSVDFATIVAICVSEARKSDSSTMGQEDGDQPQLDVLVGGICCGDAKRN